MIEDFAQPAWAEAQEKFAANVAAGLGRLARWLPRRAKPRDEIPAAMPVQQMKTFQGRCHCGRLKLEFSTERDPHSFAPREDGCGFCQRHRAMAIADPDGSLCVYLPADPPKPYRFGLNITDFHVCDRCGVWVAATWRDGDGLRGVINLPALDDRGLFDTAPVAVNFDGEDIPAREARRRAGWTPARIVTAQDR